MKLIDLVNARHSMQKLVAQDLPLRQAYRLMKLTEACNFHLQFYGNEMEKLGPDPDPEKLAELDGMEITDLPEEKLTVPMLDGVRLSASDIKALEPFVTFCEEED